MRRLFTWFIMVPALFGLFRFLFGLLLLAAVLGAGGLYLYASSQPELLPKGTKVAGIDVGGMRPSEAQKALDESWVEIRDAGDQLKSGKRVWALSAKRLGLSSDRDQQLAKAVDEVHQTPDIYRLLKDEPKARQWPETFAVDDKAVDRLLVKVSKRVAVKPKDAQLTLTQQGPSTIEAVPGKRLDRSGLKQQIREALTTPGRQTVALKLKSVKAKITSAQQLAEAYPASLVADRNTYQLKLYHGRQLVKIYKIAVGSEGHDTPPGLYNIANKAVNPVWHVPNSAWAGSLAGQVIPGGLPNNPLKARWLGIADGVGIHGTSDDSSIGSAASHGCLRMHVPDVIDLSPRVPVGSQILII